MSHCDAHEDREDCECPKRTECIDTCPFYGISHINHEHVNHCICLGNHRCWKESCQKEYPFGEKHDCDACPCGGDHQPNEHMCWDCEKSVYYPIGINHC